MPSFVAAAAMAASAIPPFSLVDNTNTCTHSLLVEMARRGESERLLPFVLGAFRTFLLVWGRVLIGVVLAGVVWVYGTYIAPGGGLDGPCIGAADFTLGAREGSTHSSEWSLLPPGVRCVEERPNGTEREQTYPGPVTFAVAGAAFMLPFVLRRRDGVGGPSRAGARGAQG
jgi:hypothetical protein